MNREAAERNTILLARTGSRLYGTDRPGSDEDFTGVFMPPAEEVFGLRRTDEVDLSVKARDGRGKNTAEAVDRKLYEFRRFVALAMENNPNILEVLFVNEANVVTINDTGRALLAMGGRFPHRGLKEKFLGYAAAQKHKMIIKKDNYFDLVRAREFLGSRAPGRALWELEAEMDPSLFAKRLKKATGSVGFFAVGDINLLPSLTVKNALRAVAERLDRVGSREELYLAHAYDTKFAMHLVRLMLEGRELLRTGELRFPLAEREMLREIRGGAWPIERVMEFAAELEAGIEEEAARSPLPAGPPVDEIEGFVIETMRGFLMRQLEEK